MTRSRLLDSIPVFLRIQLSRGAHWLLRMGEERREVLALSNQLRQDLASGTLHRTIPDHYAGGVEIQKWQSYKAGFGEDNDHTFRNRFVLEQIRDLDFSTFVNFGCLYGWLESRVHALGKTVYGVDRATESKALNETEFPGPRFVASDIVDFLQTQKLDSFLFSHINTGTYFLPAFLVSLYKLAHEKGARFIAIYEPSGVSRATGSYYNYSEDPQPSRVFRGVMLLNNYPNLLKQAGFRVVRSEILRPPHPHRDFRSAFFLAERV
jgi:hypothetical protein